MTEGIATTPFGGGAYTIALFQAQKKFEERRKALKDNSNQTGKTDKWQLLRALTEAKSAFDLTDRAITVLEALMSFHPEKELDGAKDMIVFPSNVELGLRTRGMSAATLRRHIATLIKSGLLLRRDSPNGKRFVRRDSSGAISDAFGFNLAPAALMAPEIFERADEARAHAAAVRKVRGEITLHLRDISKMIEAARFDGHCGRDPSLWQALERRLQALSGRVSRHMALGSLQERCEALFKLHIAVEKAFLDAMNEDELQAADRSYEADEANRYKYLNQNMSGNDSHNERHIQNSNTNTSFEISKESNEAEDNSHIENPEDKNEARSGSPKEAANRVTIAELKQACPEFGEYALNGLTTWQEAREAAELARPMLGISPDAWRKAQAAMGTAGAVISIAYLIERAGEIKSSGGYLRALTEKAERGKFHVRPMLDSLLNRT